jgi:1-acyl-sn-glycerol-3-phosphate acyltransferase
MMIFFSIFLPFIYLLRAIGHAPFADKMVAKITTFWARNNLFLNGIDYEVHGIEHIPQDNRICLVSNHQSNFDIPLILGNIPKVIGFISKVELSRIPMLNLWMYVIRCPFINRNNKEQAVEIIKKRVQTIEKGHPMLIFPEGKRSKMQDMNSFKKAGLSAIIEADTSILPLTVCNTYSFFEGGGKIDKRQKAKLIIHQSFKPSEKKMSNDELRLELERIIHPDNLNIRCLD